MSAEPNALIDKLSFETYSNFILKELSKKSQPSILFSDEFKAYNDIFLSHNHGLNNTYDLLSAASSRKYRNPQPDRHVQWVGNAKIEKIYRNFLYRMAPHEHAEREKIRIGGNRDGGCVLLSPGAGGNVISFGVSTKINARERDFDLAERGFKVFQFDKKLKSSPKNHPGIRFGQYADNLALLSGNPAEFRKRFGINGSANGENFLLLDLEGGEWPLLENIKDETLQFFSQIYLELHGLTNMEKIGAYASSMEKLLKYFVPIHIHYHNGVKVLGFRDFFISDLIELTFARRELGKFMLSPAVYPTALDFPTIPDLPDLPIGNFLNAARYHD